MEPRAPRAVGGDEAGDLLGLAQGRGDLVVAAQQRLAAEGRDGEADARRVAANHRLALEIDFDLRVLRRGFETGNHGGEIGGLDDSDEQPVAKGVLIEDVGETRRRDSAYAETLQCPDRRLARAAAAEILAG